LTTNLATTLATHWPAGLTATTTATATAATSAPATLFAVFGFVPHRRTLPAALLATIEAAIYIDDLVAILVAILVALGRAFWPTDLRSTLSSNVPAALHTTLAVALRAT